MKIFGIFLYLLVISLFYVFISETLYLPGPGLSFPTETQFTLVSLFDFYNFTFLVLILNDESGTLQSEGPGSLYFMLVVLDLRRSCDEGIDYYIQMTFDLGQSKKVLKLFRDSYCPGGGILSLGKLNSSDFLDIGNLNSQVLLKLEVSLR